MSTPVSIQFKFGNDFAAVPNNDPVLTDELKDRITKLLTGKFDVDVDGRCVIEPPGFQLPVNYGQRDSVCVGVDLGPITFEYCKDID